MFGVAATQEGSYPVTRFFVGNGDNCGFLDRRMAIKPGFDFSELDTIASSFDHAVAAPQVGVIAVWRLDHDVTGLVPPAVGLVFVKRASGLLGQ